jgi:hypothetical protein
VIKTTRDLVGRAASRVSTASALKSHKEQLLRGTWAMDVKKSNSKTKTNKDKGRWSAIVAAPPLCRDPLRCIQSGDPLYLNFPSKCPEFWLQ